VCSWSVFEECPLVRVIISSDFILFLFLFFYHQIQLRCVCYSMLYCVLHF